MENNINTSTSFGNVRDIIGRFEPKPSEQQTGPSQIGSSFSAKVFNEAPGETTTAGKTASLEKNFSTEQEVSPEKSATPLSERVKTNISGKGSEKVNSAVRGSGVVRAKLTKAKPMAPVAQGYMSAVRAGRGTPAHANKGAAKFSTSQANVSKLSLEARKRKMNLGAMSPQKFQEAALQTSEELCNQYLQAAGDSEEQLQLLESHNKLSQATGQDKSLQKNVNLQMKVSAGLVETFDKEELGASLSETVDMLCTKHGLSDSDVTREARLLGTDENTAKLKMVKKLVTYRKGGMSEGVSPSMAKKMDSTGYELSTVKGVEKAFKQHVSSGKAASFQKLSGGESVLLSKGRVVVEEKKLSAGSYKVATLATDYFSVKSPSDRGNLVSLKPHSEEEAGEEKTVSSQTQSQGTDSTPSTSTGKQEVAEENLSTFKPQGDDNADYSTFKPQGNDDADYSTFKPQGDDDADYSTFKPQGNDDTDYSTFKPQGDDDADYSTFKPQGDDDADYSTFKPQGDDDADYSTFKPQGDDGADYSTFKPQANDDADYGTFKPQGDDDTDYGTFQPTANTGTTKSPEQTSAKQPASDVPFFLRKNVKFELDPAIAQLPTPKLTNNQLNQIKTDLQTKLEAGDESVQNRLSNVTREIEKRKVDNQLLEQFQDLVANPNPELEYHHEIELVQALQGPHVVKMHGVVDLETGEKIMLQEAAGYKLEPVPGVRDEATTAIDMEKMSKLAHENKLTDDEQMKMYDLFDQAFAGVLRMHEEGYIHRDLKEENILVTRDGNAVLTDFGSTVKEKQDFRKCGFNSTPPYAAPEAARFNEDERWDSVDQKSDVWTCGLMVHNSLLKGQDLGTHPAVGDRLYVKPQDSFTQLKFMHQDKIKQQYNTDYPEPASKNSLEHLVWSATRIEPEERPSMEEFLQRYRSIVQDIKNQS